MLWRAGTYVRGNCEEFLWFLLKPCERVERSGSGIGSRSEWVARDGEGESSRCPTMTIGLAQPSSLSTPNNSPSPIQTVVIRPRPLPVRSTPTAPVCPLNHHHGPTLFVARINLAMTDSAPTSSQISYVPYDPAQEATQLESVRELISSELSEPYSIYVYRYFLYQWGDLCYLASGALLCNRSLG